MVYFTIFAVVSLLSYFFFSHFKLLYTDVDSARYVLSSLIQSEAGILAIVVTLSLVAVQLAASSSPRVVDIFKRTPDLWILIIIYIFSIVYCVTLLKLIINTQSRISDLEYYILFAYFISMFAFLSLIPYIWNILDLMKPSTIIDKLASRITKESILDAIGNDEMVKGKDDPIQPIIDIMHASLMKYDYGTFREGLKAIQNSVTIILNGKISKNEKSMIVKHVSTHLSLTKKLTADSGDVNLIEQIIDNIKKI
ncbi:MAG: DUF2254 domain-containing protein [Methanobacterium sp.]|uniref:DUF2254 family protein n=1 Tax=Methanobacterium sp. TaxID=2164 RepID=UPI003D6464F9|nr:DUF2254 domain-containing protein [Methanobacterium sp.]